MLHMRTRFVYEQFSLRSDAEASPTPFLQMCTFSVVPTRTFMVGMLPSEVHDVFKLHEMLITQLVVHAPYLVEFFVHRGNTRYA